MAAGRALGAVSNKGMVFESSNSTADALTPLTTTTYYQGDQIGSARILTAAGGWPLSSDAYYPFGLEQTVPTDANHYKYTGLERDGESGMDTATFRTYASLEGRWTRPDPYDGSYDASNPQSFNRYAYVLNNPLSATDPDGEDESAGGLCYYTASCGGSNGGGGVGGGGIGLGQQEMYANSTYTSVTSDNGNYVYPGSLFATLLANPGAGITVDNDGSFWAGGSIYGTVTTGSFGGLIPQYWGGVTSGGGGSSGVSAPSNGWDWDEKPHWPAPTTTRQQPFKDCFNGAMNQSAPPGKNTVTVVTTLTSLWNLISPNPVAKTAGAANALFNLGRITSAALVCSDGSAHF